jgi:hypothetical protein
VPSASEPLSPIDKLLPTHEVESFDCGKEPLNDFLKRFALVNQRNGSSLTYVACRGQRVVGYYSLAVGSVMYEAAPGRVAANLKAKPTSVSVWFYTTGKKIKGIKKIAPARYAYSSQ